MPIAKVASNPVVGVRYTPRRGHFEMAGKKKQASAKFDLSFVIDRYLPEKLKHPEKLLS